MLIIQNQNPFTLIAGPCVIESQEHTLFMAKQLTDLTRKYNIPFIFKSSFDKANRTNVHAHRGISVQKGLETLKMVKEKYSCPVLTDVHTPEQCIEVAQIVDYLQIPAFLCRQTDLLEAAAKTGKPINVKKGQFLAPWDMKNIVEKLIFFGAKNIFLCERGSCFGYNTLVNDMRALSIMKSLNCPVVFDATHSVQKPGGKGNSTDGERIFAPIIARAALAIGVAGIFAEVHDDPDQALSDGPNMIKLSDFEKILIEWKEIDFVAKKYPREI